MFCPDCGNKIEEGSVFCASCGVRVGNKPSVSECMTLKRPAFLYASMIWLLLVGMVLLFISFRLWGGGNVAGLSGQSPWLPFLFAALHFAAFFAIRSLYGWGRQLAIGLYALQLLLALLALIQSFFVGFPFFLRLPPLIVLVISGGTIYYLTRAEVRRLFR